MIDEGSVDEAKVHHFGRLGEMQIVTIAPAAEAVGALEKFVADAGAPFRSKGRGDLKVKALGIELLDAIVDGGRTASRSFVEHGGEGRACVFNVEVKLAG